MGYSGQICLRLGKSSKVQNSKLSLSFVKLWKLSFTSAKCHGATAVCAHAVPRHMTHTRGVHMMYCFSRFLSTKGQNFSRLHTTTKCSKQCWNIVAGAMCKPIFQGAS